MRSFLIATTLLVAASALATTPTIDGLSIPSEFASAAVAVQDTNTQFGDNENELDRMFVTSDAGFMYIGITGNLADNNALTIFLQTTPLGDTGAVLDTNPPGPCPGDNPTVLRMLSGTTMDDGADPDAGDGFNPNWALTISVGKFPGHSDYQLVLACDLTDLTTNTTTSLGIGAVTSRPGQPTPAGSGLLTGNSGVKIAIDNRNDVGVGDWGGSPTPNPGDAESADSGIEIAIPRSLISLAANTNVTLFAFLTNNAQGGGVGPCDRAGYASNQALPGLGGNGNLASFDTVNPPLIDFSGPQGPGTQFVTVLVP